MTRRSLWALAAYAVACSSSHAGPPPLTATFGSWHLSVTPGTANVVLAGPDGTPLVEGLDPSNDVGTPQSANDDAPPMTGFAVREVATSYEMLYGSFKITDDTSHPWRVVESARWTSGTVFDLLAGDGSVLATITFAQGEDAGSLIADIQPGAGPERRFSWGFRCNATDQFAGFGAQTWGVDARKETIPVWVQEEGVGKDLSTDDPTGVWFLVGRRHSAYMPMPEFLSRRGFVAAADTAHLSTFALCSERDDVARMQVELPVQIRFFYGPGPHDAVGRMTAHFGRPRVPPAFAFAPWNDAIFGSANVRRIAGELRSMGIPSSVVWTEDWRGGAFSPTIPDLYQLEEEWDVDRTLYPDFEQVATDLHGMGFKWLVYFNSFVEQDSLAWPETAPNGFLIRDATGQPYTFTDAKQLPASMVDLTNPAAVAWAAGKMTAAIELGADGWMGDFSEWLPTDATLAGGSGLDLHHQYPLLWQKAQRQALDTAIAADGVERLSFVRSGWFGTPALADVWWGGDQRTDFEADDGMPTVLPIGIGVGLTGVSTFGSDIAGYQNATNGPSSKELFFRWTELGAWSPVMRTHHGSYPKLNWSFESDADTLAHWARYAKLHIALAPYMRGLAQAAHDTGVSIWRALAVEFPGDDASWPVADEVMVGERVLLAPVQAPGLTARPVYLPPGTWFPWSGGPSVPGGGSAPTVQAPMTEVPVFARAGAIVPTYPDGVQTLTVEPSPVANAASVKDDRVVYVFAGDSSSFAEAPDSGGLSYALTSSGGGNAATAQAAWNGTTLGACASTPVAPCVATSADGVTAYVVGGGVLGVTSGTVEVAKVTVQGGAPTRRLTLIVRM